VLITKPHIQSRTTKSCNITYIKKVKDLLMRTSKKNSKNIMSCFKWYFNNPDSEYKIVNVAGTNGKGSVTIKIASLLEKSGFKVGMFISPHIASIRERCQINRHCISEIDFIKYYEIVEKFEKDEELQCNFFVTILIMSILYFKDQKCDYVVLECGIGGFASSVSSFDAKYAAITSIGFDHVDILGLSADQI
jgi:dihydrofolate synthase / folylpolyglutamate synthase